MCHSQTQLRKGDEITLKNVQVFPDDKNNRYKYLDVLETDQTKHNEIKIKVRTEYLT